MGRTATSRYVLRVRREPYGNSETIEQVPSGEAMRVLGSLTDENGCLWYELELPSGNSGYCRYINRGVRNVDIEETLTA